jgi:hypothetical protein
MNTVLFINVIQFDKNGPFFFSLHFDALSKIMMYVYTLQLVNPSRFNQWSSRRIQV